MIKDKDFSVFVIRANDGLKFPPRVGIYILLHFHCIPAAAFSVLSVPDASLLQREVVPNRDNRPNSIVDSGTRLVTLRQLGSPVFFQIMVCFHTYINEYWKS